MKLFNLIVLAILNFSLIAAYPDKIQKNGNFVFWITGYKSGECDIQSLGPNYKNAKSITIPTYINVEGDKYYVRSIMHGALANENFETVTFPRTIKKIYLEDSSFANCKKLKKVIINTNGITINSNAFSGCDNINYDGSGVPSLVSRLSEELLKRWKFEIDYPDYHDNTWENKQKYKTDLYLLGKKIRENIRLGGNYGANLVNVLMTHRANTRGMHMLFRELAITMGVDESYIFVASDYHCSFWAYVKEDHDKYYDEWHNVDIFDYDYSKYKGKTYPSDFYKTNSAYSKRLVDRNATGLVHDIHKQPYNWVMYIARYGTDTENLYEHHENFSEYIRDNDPGSSRS
eukprot:jgi/Orpsp1_1/1188726/evm.model.d7180000066799.1